MTEFDQQLEPYKDLLYIEEGEIPFVLCNDFFFWGCADGEDVTPENFALFKECIELAGRCDGPLLFCAKIKQERPQGIAYGMLNPEYWPLFDACGPEREVGFGNPVEHP